MIRKLFLLWGSEGEGEEGAEGAEGQTEESGSKESEETRTITNKDLEAMTARAADKATRKAKKDLVSTLGFDNTASLQEFIETQKAAQDAATDEQTKALQEAERSKKEYDAGMSDLAEQRLQLSISQAVVGAGLADPKKVQRVAALVRDDLDEDILDEEDWSGAVADALKELQGDMPELFVKSGFGSGDGGSQGGSTQTDEEKAAAKDKEMIESYEKQGLVYHPL
jgi:hypothetical protein